MNVRCASFNDVLTFVDTIQKTPKTNRIVEQLVGAAGSIGNNREEARGASSRKEFTRYNEIALRSANEIGSMAPRMCHETTSAHATNASGYSTKRVNWHASSATSSSHQNTFDL